MGPKPVPNDPKSQPQNHKTKYPIQGKTKYHLYIASNLVGQSTYPMVLLLLIVLPVDWFNVGCHQLAIGCSLVDVIISLLLVSTG